MPLIQTSTRICLSLFFGLFLSLVSASATAVLDKSDSERLIDSLEGQVFVGFDGFLSQVAALTPGTDNLPALIQQYQAGTVLDDADRNTLFRLLGIYTRVKYGDQALATLSRLVAIPTSRVEGLPQHENPNFIRMGATLAQICADFNLQFRNIDERVYEISLPGTGPEVIAVHAHADVVPANPDLWVLDDGRKLDPFVVTAIGDRLYGRGTQDDKNGIVVGLYAMKVIKEENLSLLRSFHLLIDTTEETGGTAMPYYFQRNPVPDYNIAIDGSYPVVIAEKGSGTVMAHFPVRTASGEGGEIVSLTGGLASNQIPSTSTARILSSSPNELAANLNRQGSSYAAAHGDDFLIEATASSAAVQLTVRGVSAHSSEPQSGVNPVARMLDFVDSDYARSLFKQNHITDAARYVAENWGLDYLGNVLGVAYADSFMGPLTASPTFVALDNTQLRLAVNLRLPVGKAPATLVEELTEKLESWKEMSHVVVDFDIGARDPMYRSPEGAWVNALLDIGAENMALPREFVSSAGGTSIHNLPNGVQFGLADPRLKYTGHNANEFKTRSQFLLDLQIITEMFARIGSMPSL